MSDWRNDGPLLGWTYETQGESAAYCWGAAVAFGLMGMAEAIRERTWNCIMCEGDTDGDTCEWCQAPRGLRCPACEVGPCEDHVRSAGDRSKADE